MKRRTFLQRIGSILTVLGVAEAEWLTLGNRYYQALAQPAPRKLALLIGINKYAQSPALAGCLTDVELQKELLVNRFGFAGSDILTLTEEEASREFIEAAILDHLGKQTQAEDVALFHFSGYGSQVLAQNALVPVDERNAQNKDFVNYVLEETLLLLLRSLPTNNVTAVLDTSYGLPETFRSTGLKVRSLPSTPNLQLVSQEQEFLQLLKNKISQPQPIFLFKATAEPQQVARELLLSGVNAGLFTYALTQYLWEVTPPSKIYTVLSYAGSSMYKLGSTQQPVLVDGVKQNHLIDILPVDRSGAEGVIKAIEEEGKTVKLLLTGLPAQVLESYGTNSRFTTTTGDVLVLRSRTGINAKAQLANSETSKTLQVGQLVQESIRLLPHNLNLTVGLDPGLERIERVDATSAFASSAKVSTVLAGEQPADYIFGKLEKANTRYALFSRFGELIPNTTGDSDEAVKLAVKRLLSKLPTLLAAKLWQLTDNQGSSRLAVQGTLEIVGGITPKVVIHRQTLRTHHTTPKTAGLHNQTAIPQVPIGSRMQYRLQNLSDRPLYIMLVGLNNSSNAIAFYPWQVPPANDTTDTEPQLDNLVIPPGTTLTIPETAVSEWAIPGLSLLCQHQIIFSTAPFTETLAALISVKNTGGRKPIATLANPLEVAQALLQDLHNASAIKTEPNGTTPEALMLDVRNWASLNFSFQVV
ncbi:MAG TPA: caspase family protein [Nostocaceae cyanobacterium]|nr:caspase family protein [Nostocaceae cyanobacterium]